MNVGEAKRRRAKDPTWGRAERDENLLEEMDWTPHHRANLMWRLAHGNKKMPAPYNFRDGLAICEMAVLDQAQVIFHWRSKHPMKERFKNCKEFLDWFNERYPCEKRLEAIARNTEFPKYRIARRGR